MLRLLILILACFGTTSLAPASLAQDPSPAEDVVSSPDVVEEGSRNRKTAPPRMGGDDRRGGRSMRRMENPSKADIDSFILVASDIKPEWKTTLESMRSGDPEKFQQTLRGLGRRIWYLVELKAQNPNLYQLRIAEIRNDEQLWAFANAHRESLTEGDVENAKKILEQLKDLALVQVDLKLRVRAEELAAMASALEKLRTEVLIDLEQRQIRADAMVENLLSGKRPRERRGMRGPALNGAPSERPLRVDAPPMP